jgi:anaerobic selenocysteine-containing dehydrogenase
LIQQMGSGAIDLLLVHGANPIFELPPGTGIADAIKKVPSVISFAPIVDETAVWADVILPDNTYLESWGYSVPSPDFAIPMVGSQQPVVQPYFDTRSTGDILLAIAKNIPVLAPALPWPNEFELVKARIKQLGRSLAGGLGDDVFFARFQQNGVWYQTAEPNLATLSSSVSPGKPASPSYQGDAGTYPYHLHLYLSDFLSDGKGAAIPWLQGSPDPMTTIAWQTWVEINPATAAKLGVAYGDVVKVTSPFGEIEALVYIYPTIRTDTVAIPIGQGHTDYGRYARDRGANPVALLGGSSPGGEMDWELIRVNIAPTGKHTFLATFENTFGVIHGLINEEFPGK